MQIKLAKPFTPLKLSSFNRKLFFFFDTKRIIECVSVCVSYLLIPQEGVGVNILTGKKSSVWLSTRHSLTSQVLLGNPEAIVPLPPPQAISVFWNAKHSARSCVCVCVRARVSVGGWVGTYGFARLCALQSICAHVPVTYLKSNKLHWRPGAAAVKYNNIWKLCYLVLARSIEGTLQNAAPTKNIPSISQTINILEEVCVWVPWLSALPTSLPFIFKSTTLKLAISNPKNGFL